MLVKPSSILGENLKTPDWLVPNILPKGRMIVLAGEAGVGKSVLSYTLSVALASGVPFLGRNTQPTTVLYFDEENSLPDFHTYVNWAWCGLGCPPVSDLDTRLKLVHFGLSAAGPLGWTAEAQRLAREYQPGLVVIDTATPACHIKDENDNGEATQAIIRLRGIRAAGGPDTTCLLLKHARVDKATGRYDIRGAKVWVGATDGTLFHLRHEGRPRKGLNPTRLVPHKLRAQGLRDELTVHPEWVYVGDFKGLSLAADEAGEK